MEIKSSILDKLKCDLCGGILSCGPVIQLNNGQSGCGRCSAPDSQTATRNFPYEHLAEDMLFPCKNKEYGCSALTRFSDVKQHEEECVYLRYTCIMAMGDECGWSGSKHALLAHCKSAHPGQLLENPATLQHDITISSLRTFLVAAFNMLFILHAKVCLQSKNIYYCVRLISRDDQASNFSYKVNISNENGDLTRKGKVASHGSLVLEEHLSVILDINGLIKALDGFKGTTFKITINEDINNIIKCYTCHKNITYQHAYNYSSGWLCETHIPAKEHCHYSPRCSYTDVHIKSRTHAGRYCIYCLTCPIFNEAYPNLLTDHFNTNHSQILHEHGQAITEYVKEDFQYVIINSDVGTLFCTYILRSLEFSFHVFSSIVGGKLHLYKCVLELQNPISGYTIQKTMVLNSNDTIYTCDWMAHIKRKEFLRVVHENQFKYKLNLRKIKTYIEN